MDELKFKIKSRGKVIAAFANRADQGLCLDALESYYGDCEFETEPPYPEVGLSEEEE
jgi:hypothetical protein